MLIAACHAFAPTSPVGLTSVASPFRGQQLWRSVDDDSGSHSALIRQMGSPPPPLMLDEWVAVVQDQHRPPTGAVAAADSDSFYGFLPSFEGAARPGGGAISFVTPCFGAVRVTVTITLFEISATSSLDGAGNASAQIKVTLNAALACVTYTVRTLTEAAPHASKPAVLGDQRGEP